MWNGIEVSTTSINYLGLSQNQSIFARTSLASDAQSVDQSQNSPNIPKEYYKHLNQNSLLWLLQQKTAVERLAIAQQVHGSVVRYVSTPGVYENIDGFYTDQPEVYLTIRTADCAAVFVSVPDVPAVGIAHVGWRGTKANITTNLLRQMTDKWKVDARQIQIAVSPHIKACCYEVGSEFMHYFQPQYLRKRNNQLQLDLDKVILDQLIAFGIEENQVCVSGECTYCSDLSLYSYRKQNRTENRLLSVIAIQE